MYSFQERREIGTLLKHSNTLWAVFIKNNCRAIYALKLHVRFLWKWGQK